MPLGRFMEQPILLLWRTVLAIDAKEKRFGMFMVYDLRSDMPSVTVTTLVYFSNGRKQRVTDPAAAVAARQRACGGPTGGSGLAIACCPFGRDGSESLGGGPSR